MEGILLGFIYTFLIVISFETIFSRILATGSKHSGKKIFVLAIQSLVISLFFFAVF